MPKLTRQEVEALVYAVRSNVNFNKTITGDEAIARLRRIIGEDNNACPRCGAKGDEPCLTWNAMAFLDGTTHEERQR